MSRAVSVLGLGNIGTALARVLLEGGNAVTVWNRSPCKAEALAASGAHVAATAEEAVASSPVTIICVARYEHVYASLSGITEADLSGRALVNLTWGTPEDAQRMEHWVHARGGSYLDGGIPVTPAAIGRPETELVYSGSTQVWDRHAEVLRQLGGASRHVGEGISDANVLSLAIPGTFYALAYGAFLEAAAYAASHGVVAADLRSLVRSSLRVLEEVVDDSVRALGTGDYATDQATLGIVLDSMVIVREAMERQRQQGTMTKALVEVLERGVEAGHADEACAAIVSMLKEGG